MRSSVGPGYRQTEIGVIPEDWELLSLGALFAFQNGVNADKSAYGKGVPFINVLEVITHRSITEARIPGQVLLPSDAINSYAVQPGDVLFNRTSETQEEVGLASVYAGQARVVFGGFVIRGRPKGDLLESRFASYALRSAAVRAQIVALGQGVVRANIGQQDLSRVLVAMPAKSEQEAIAEAMSDADALIESLEHLIAKKRHLKQGAMQDLLTGNKHLRGFTCKWEKTELGRAAKQIVGGGTPSRAIASYWNGDIPWMTVKDFANHNFYGTLECITREGLRSSASHLIPKHTLITSTRMALGKAVMFEVDVSINQDLKAIFTTSDTDAQFLYYWFQLNGPRISEMGSGSTVMGISLSELRKISFAKPSYPEQVAIAAILSDMDAEIAALEAKLAKARQLKQGMMQELLTGKTRLS